MGSVGKHSIRVGCKSLRPEVKKDWDETGSSGQDRMMPCELTAAVLGCTRPAQDQASQHSRMDRKGP